MIEGMGYWEVWIERLRRAKGIAFALPDETDCIQLDDHARGTGSRVILPAGTKVEYVETTYDAMIPDRCHHTMRVTSGPSAGSWVALADFVGLEFLPWEQ